MSQRSRRALLAGLLASSVASVSGCLVTTPREIGSIGPEPTDPPPDARRHVAVGAVSGTRDVPIDVSMSTVDPWITRDRTAVLRATLTNAAASTVETQIPYHQGASSWDGTPGILLYARTAACRPSVDEASSCWDTEQPSRGELAWCTEAIAPFEVEPDEERTFDLIVADDPTVAGCVPPGRYRFENPRGVDSTRYVLEFAIEVTDVGGDD